MIVRTAEQIETKRATIGTAAIFLAVAILFAAVTMLGVAQMA